MLPVGLPRSFRERLLPGKLGVDVGRLLMADSRTTDTRCCTLHSLGVESQEGVPIETQTADGWMSAQS
jgi:hypothetical protein